MSRFCAKQVYERSGGYRDIAVSVEHPEVSVNDAQHLAYVMCRHHARI
jgi:hypothetical protein